MAKEQDRFSTILEQIQGAAFFATPHRGASDAGWGEIFGKTVKASSLGIRGNTKPLKDLRDRGQVVQDISRSSVDRVKKLCKTPTFVEMRKMSYLNFRVNQWSKFRNMTHDHIQVVSEDSASKRSGRRTLRHGCELPEYLHVRKYGGALHPSEDQNKEHV
jgi:hypothetical protein